MTRFEHGSAYLEEVRPTNSGVEARLVYPGGESRVVRFNCVIRDSDRELPPGLGTPLSVLVRPRGGTFECSLLGSTSTGPRTNPITLRQALALAEQGTHTVVSAEGGPAD